MNWFVYALICPISHAVKYIGITSHPLDYRLIVHMRETHNAEKAAWISLLKSQGLTPIIKELERIHGTRARAEQREEKYVLFCLALGFPLFNKNHVPGGKAEDYIAFLNSLAKTGF